MRIYDVTTFHDEYDVLACRIHELQHEVDYFCVAMGNMTQQGGPLAEPPDIAIERLRQQFNWLGPRLRIMVVDLDRPVPGTRVFGDEAHWVRFHRQQNAAIVMLDDADDDDLVFFGDVDEIPRRGMSVLRPDGERLMAFKQRHHVYSWGWVVDEPWIGTGLARVGFARKHGLHRVRCGRPIENLTVIHNGGWHASWFGGIDACRRKINSFTHPELKLFEPALEWAMKYGITCDGRRMFRVSYDPKYREDWPEYLHCGEMKGHWL